MSRPLRILALGPESYGGFAGIAQGTRDFVDALLAWPDGAEVVLLARRSPDGGPGPPPGLAQRVHSGSAWRMAKDALRAGAGGHFDLVFCLHTNLAPVAAGLKRLLGLPVWLVLHGVDARRPSSGLRARSVRSLDVATASSRWTKSEFLAWSGVEPARVHVVNNPVHRERFGPGPKPRRLVERYDLAGRRVLLTLGRLPTERSKGHEELLGVLPDLFRRRPELSWLVVGDGPDRERLERRVRETGFADRVVFAGRVPEEEKRDHYLVADAFALPSTTEGFGIVYLEAAACGLPVLGSRRDGSSDALCDGDLGILVDPLDRAELLDGLERLLTSRRGVPDELERFTPERLHERMHAVLAGLLSAGRERSAAA